MNSTNDSDWQGGLAAKLRNAVGLPSIVDTAIIKYSVVQEVIASLEASSTDKAAARVKAELEEKVKDETANWTRLRDENAEAAEDDGWSPERVCYDEFAKGHLRAYGNMKTWLNSTPAETMSTEGEG